MPRCRHCFLINFFHIATIVFLITILSYGAVLSFFPIYYHIQIKVCLVFPLFLANKNCFTVLVSYVSRPLSCWNVEMLSTSANEDIISRDKCFNVIYLDWFSSMLDDVLNSYLVEEIFLSYVKSRNLIVFLNAKSIP